MTDSESMQLSEQAGQVLRVRDTTVTTAKSCTGGQVVRVITDVTGDSAWFERGFITYNNEVKTQMIDVHKETLTQHGAASRPVVMEMAIGVLKAARADYAMPISDIARPDDGGEEKLISTIWFTSAIARGEGITRRECFSGDRDTVRRQVAAYVLQAL